MISHQRPISIVYYILSINILKLLTTDMILLCQKNRTLFMITIPLSKQK
jgi:hypothetical protein